MYILCLRTYLHRGWVKKVDKPKTWLLIKNPLFCSNQANILATKSAHEMIILTKFHKDRTKIVDFLLIAKFWACILFFVHPLVFFKKNNKVPILPTYFHFKKVNLKKF